MKKLKKSKYKFKLGHLIPGRRLAEVEERHVEILEAIQVTNANLMLRLQDTTSVDANPYKTHLEQVTEIMLEYAGGTDLGSDLIKRVINISAALKVPNGLALEGDPKSAEFIYLTKFMGANQLNEGLCTELSKEGEKQGQVLVQLPWDPNTLMVKVFYYPWDTYQYEVRPIGFNNMTPPYEISWQAVADSTLEAGVLNNSEIAFVAFNLQFKSNDKLQLIIEGSPTLANCLQRIDDIGLDLIDWRQSNKLYAHPTPNLKIEDADEAQSINDKVSSSGWTTGQMLISSGDLTMVVPENFYLTIKEAIHTNIQFVSGATGLSVAWLGFPNLMSNRAVSDSLGEPLEIVAANDITSWKSFYEQMFDNVIEIRNINMPKRKKLRTGKVKPLLKPMSDRIWQQLIRLYLPAAEGKTMSRETFWRMIPGFPIEEERERFKKQQKEDEESQIRVIKKTKLDNRQDTGQQSTGDRSFNNEPG